jgi:hypothetical protein
MVMVWPQIEVPWIDHLHISPEQLHFLHSPLGILLTRILAVVTLTTNKHFSIANIGRMEP